MYAARMVHDEGVMEENIYLRLAKARVEVQKRCTKKSGHNKFAGFDYFELGDFLPQATEELSKVGLVALFNIGLRAIDTVENKVTQEGVVTEEKKKAFKEVATLTITDGENEIVFETPTADVEVKGANLIQNLGSKHTYLKRYLYMNAMEMSEHDGVDATIKKEDETDKKSPEKPVKKCSQAQISSIKKRYREEEIPMILTEYSIEKLEDLSVKDASDIIQKRS